MALVLGIIPARFDATRLPGKLLLDLKGKSVLERTWRQATQAGTLSRVVIAAADEKIFKAATDFGAEVVRVFDDVPSGSDRIARAVKILYPGPVKPEIIVNIQGDEPLLDPSVIDAVVTKLATDPEAGVGTAMAVVRDEAEYLSPATVKVVTGGEGRALYFSRAPIPHGWSGITATARRHIGLYAYRWDSLQKFVNLKPSPLEVLEKLEQLRLLEHGVKYLCVEVEDQGLGIDTREDLEQARLLLT